VLCLYCSLYSDTTEKQNNLDITPSIPLKDSEIRHPSPGVTEKQNNLEIIPSIPLKDSEIRHPSPWKVLFLWYHQIEILDSYVPTERKWLHAHGSGKWATKHGSKILGPLKLSLLCFWSQKWVALHPYTRHVWDCSASSTSQQNSSALELVKLIVLFGCQTNFSFMKMKFWYELPLMPSERCFDIL
jgi:hypothetical protein